MAKKVVNPSTEKIDLTIKLQKENASLEKKVMRLENDLLKLQNTHLILVQKHILLVIEFNKLKSPAFNISFDAYVEKMKSAGITITLPDPGTEDPILAERRIAQEAADDE